MSIKNSDLLKYRSVWILVGILWVAFYHSGINVKGIAEDVKTIGQGGVDLTLFASGVGCYYSFSKNYDVKEFIIKRFKRILPTWLIFIIIWTIYKLMVNDISINGILGNLLCYQTLTGKGGDFTWYISAIMLFYFFTPYLIYLIDRKFTWCKLLCITFIFLIVSFSFWNTPFLIMIARLPIFWIGLCIGKFFKENESMKIGSLCLWLMLCAVGAVVLLLTNKYASIDLWSYGLVWYPYILTTPGMGLFLSILMHFLAKNALCKVCINRMSLLAECSFEFFLVHVLVFDFLKKILLEFQLENRNWYWIISMIPIVIMSYLLKKAAKKVQMLTNERRVG